MQSAINKISQCSSKKSSQDTCDEAKTRILNVMTSEKKQVRSSVPQRKPLIHHSTRQPTTTTKVSLKTVADGVVLSKRLLDDVRTKNNVTVHHVDHERDQRINHDLSKYNLNYVFDKTRHSESIKYRLSFNNDDITLPKSMDLRSKCGDIFDQGDLGSCVSNSTSFCMRFLFTNFNNEKFVPSRLFIYYNGRIIENEDINEDSGLMVMDGYKSVVKYSACGENNWAYDVTKFAQQPPKQCYAAAKEHKHLKGSSLTSNGLKACLVAGFPISFGAALFESFMSDTTAQSGIVPIPDENTEERVGGHCMTIVGYDETQTAFLVANSWSDKWGIKGYCWFPYKYMLNENLVTEFWTFRF